MYVIHALVLQGGFDESIYLGCRRRLARRSLFNGPIITKSNHKYFLFFLHFQHETCGD